MTLLTPCSEDEIIALVKACAHNGRKIRVRGAGKSHPDVIDTDHISLSMEHFSSITAIDAVNRTVTVGPAMLIEDLCASLWDEGFTVQGIGSVAGQTVGGLIATGAHGHTLTMSCFAAYVTALRIIDGNGKVHQVSKHRNPSVFTAFPVAMGCLGIITEVVLCIVPRYHVSKSVSFVPYREQRAHWALEVISSSSSMMKLYPDTGVAVVVTLTRCEENAHDQDVIRCYEAHFQFFPRTYPRPKLGFLRKINQRFRFRAMRIAAHLGMKRQESQYIPIGYAVPMGNAEKVIALLDRFFAKNHPWLRGSFGIRATKADDLWLSMGYGTDVCHIGCYLTSSYGIETYVRKAENILRSQGGRPHWGKPFDISGHSPASAYPKWQDFKTLRHAMDPADVFENEWTRQIFAV